MTGDAWDAAFAAAGADTAADLAISVRAILADMRSIVRRLDSVESRAFDLQLAAGSVGPVRSAALLLGSALHAAESLDGTLASVCARLDEVGR